MPGSDIRIKSGSQRQLVNIMAQVPGPGGMAGANTVLSQVAGPISAEISPATARDMIRGGQTVSQTITPITIRFLPAPNGPPGVSLVAAGMVVQRVQSTQGKYYVTGSYTVQGIINVDERNWKITLACVALGANT